MAKKPKAKPKDRTIPRGVQDLWEIVAKKPAPKTKRKPERTPDNKAVEAPENKSAPENKAATKRRKGGR